MIESDQAAIRLDSPDLSEDHDLYAILHSALKNRAVAPRADGPSSQGFWPASHFGLDRVTLFREAGECEQEAVLLACSRAVLAESYYIEKCGMYFASKMSLLAESAQEQMLYSHFAADEATHFYWISNYVSRSDVESYLPNPFIAFLAELLEKEGKPVLTYIVQVVLEGWGISHYHSMARDCNDAGLREAFENIIRDEARHHGSGLVLFGEQRLSSGYIETIIDILERFFRMVQVGPQMIASQIARARGPLSREQKVRVFEELCSETVTAGKIENLKSLIRSAAHSDAILKELERRDALRPFTAAECAALS
ncbi:MAG TPA: ferritin-like domain-containing protein [Blastocatellia bacterium]|nr:ferritin-like domain-containing protein [Blastocatellia bacterium]